MAPPQSRPASRPATGSETGPAPERRETPGRAPLRVLVVAGDAGARLRECLAGMSGFAAEAELASTPEEARTALEGGAFDVALVDFRLNEAAGGGLLDALGGGESALARIFLIRGRDAAARRAALEAGAFHLIGEEALSAESLENAVHAALHARDLETRLDDALVEAERAGRARAGFFARIGHDLKTPLTGIIGYSEAIAEESLGPLGDARYRGYAEAVREAGAHLLALIENLIHYGGDGRAADAAAFVRSDLNTLAASATRMTGLLCRKRGHTLVKNLADAPLWVDCQPAAITQALVNLLTNAIKYTGEAGRIEVTVRRAARHAEVAIADSGIGMSREDITLALQPFGRVPLPPETAQDGTGLGLPIVREIMALHRGQLDLSSTPGEGTTAVLRLPLPEEKEGRQKE